MHSLLSLIRFGIYVAVVAWTFVVLAIAAHFDQMLIASDLTRFVPLSIFISAVTLLVLTVLLLAPSVLRHNFISTRVELAFLALLSVLWLSLGAYTASAEMGDLECFADDDETEPIEVPGFSNDTYHAQYRALEGFALINVFLLLGFGAFMLLLAIRQHFKGYKTVWLTPMPLYPWFSRRNRQKPSKLPPPVTARMKSVPVPPASRPPMPQKSKTMQEAVAKARMPAPPPAARTAPKPATRAPPPPAPPVRSAQPTTAKPALKPSTSAPPRATAAPTGSASRPPARTQAPPPASRPAKQYTGQYHRPAPVTSKSAPAPGTTGGKLYSVYIPPAAPAPKRR